MYYYFANGLPANGDKINEHAGKRQDTTKEKNCEKAKKATTATPTTSAAAAAETAAEKTKKKEKKQLRNVDEKKAGRQEKSHPSAVWNPSKDVTSFSTDFKLKMRD